MMTINSPFEKLQTHTHLVVTISEEKQLYEANLKFVMLRVNGMAAFHEIILLVIVVMQSITCSAECFYDMNC